MKQGADDLDAHWLSVSGWLEWIFGGLLSRYGAFSVAVIFVGVIASLGANVAKGRVGFLDALIILAGGSFALAFALLLIGGLLGNIWKWWDELALQQLKRRLPNANPYRLTHQVLYAAISAAGVVPIVAILVAAGIATGA